jgi:Tfp pilus assembly protein PilV
MKSLIIAIIMLASFAANADDLSNQLYQQQQLQIQRQMLYEQQQYNRKLQMQYNTEQSRRIFKGSGTYIAPPTYEERRARRAYREYIDSME